MGIRIPSLQRNLSFSSKLDDFRKNRQTSRALLLEISSLELFVMGEFADLPALRRRGFLGRIAQGDEGHEFMLLSHPKNLFCLVMIQTSDDDSPQSSILGCQAKALSGKAEVKHEPVPELGARLALIKARAFHFATKGEDKGGLGYGL